MLSFFRSFLLGRPKKNNGSLETHPEKRRYMGRAQYHRLQNYHLQAKSWETRPFEEDLNPKISDKDLKSLK